MEECDEHPVTDKAPRVINYILRSSPLTPRDLVASQLSHALGIRPCLAPSKRALGKERAD